GSDRADRSHRSVRSDPLDLGARPDPLDRLPARAETTTSERRRPEACSSPRDTMPPVRTCTPLILCHAALGCAQLQHPHMPSGAAMPAAARPEDDTAASDDPEFRELADAWAASIDGSVSALWTDDLDGDGRRDRIARVCGADGGAYVVRLATGGVLR